MAPAASPGSRSEADLLAAFADHVRSFVDVGALRPLRVVADTANGMGGLVVPEVFRGLPFELEVLYPELDGTFPNHPADPIQPENLRDLQARVVETGADVGLAFDGDADRVFLVDERGRALSGSTTTAIVAAALLDRHPGRTVIHNLICSKAVPEIVREHGGVPVRTRVGHSFIKARMAETDALFGGEHSALSTAPRVLASPRSATATRVWSAPSSASSAGWSTVWGMLPRTLHASLSPSVCALSHRWTTRAFTSLPREATRWRSPSKPPCSPLGAKR